MKYLNNDLLNKAILCFCECLYQKNSSVFLKWYLTQAMRLRKFRSIHKGEDCFILGNGPSLNKIDLSLLKNYHIFGLNKIYLLFDKIDLELSYHVSVNPLVIQQSRKEFENMKCPSFLSYYAARDIIKPLSHIHFIATGRRDPSFDFDLTKILYEGYTVTYVAIQIAYYMGFERIFLIGVDHSFNFNGNPNEVKTLTTEDFNHFDPNYFRNKEWHLPDLEGSELAYNIARFVFNRGKRQIYDATFGGKLNIFEKIDYDSALNMCRCKKDIND